MVVLLREFSFDVNKEKNGDGDLLIHAAIRGGKFSLACTDKSVYVMVAIAHSLCVPV